MLSDKLLNVHVWAPDRYYPGIFMCVLNYTDVSLTFGYLQHRVNQFIDVA